MRSSLTEGDAATRREQWSAPRTLTRFFGTAALLGSSLVYTVSVWTSDASSPARPASIVLVWAVIAVALIKAASEAWGLTERRDRRHSVLRRVAIVMLGDLRRVTVARFVLLALGGLLVPCLVVGGVLRPEARLPALFMCALLVAGEACERYLFFRSAPASRMPGGLP